MSPTLDLDNLLVHLPEQPVHLGVDHESGHGHAAPGDDKGEVGVLDQIRGGEREPDHRTERPCQKDPKPKTAT